MSNGTSAAVTQAARLDEIGFPEFTTKLITDVFDALVAANIKQTEAFLELVSAVAGTLTDYINKTKDDIDGNQILQFLATVSADEGHESGTTVREGASLDDNAAGALNNALAVTDENDNVTNDSAVPADTALTEANVNAIYEAVATRLAANKYDLLSEMVKQGILRLVVEQGVIETRLTFTTYGSTFYSKQATEFNRRAFAFRAKARTGSFLSAWVNASASTSYTSVTIRTAKENHRDVSGSRVQIFGRVEINFKTDFLPLA